MRYICLMAILFAALALPKLYAHENLSYACDSPPAFSFDMADSINDLPLLPTADALELQTYYLYAPDDIYMLCRDVPKKSKRWWLMDSYLHTLLNPLPI